MKRSQRGITLVGFVIVLAVVGFFLYIGMKLFPVYSEYYSAVTDIDAIAAQPGIAKKPIDQIRNALERRFYISYVSNIDMKKNVRIETQGQITNLVVEYEVRRPLAYNLDFVAKFNYRKELAK